MKRINPFGSLLGLVLTILLFVGLGVSLWVNRGLAFSPGDVTAVKKEGVILQGFSSHAEFEKQCKYCHQPLVTDLATKCLECHATINQQIQSGDGVHSQIDNIDHCYECHPEHRGQSFDPTLAAYDLFDHSRTSFSLNWHQQNFDTTPLQCITCHLSKGDFGQVDNFTCLECHDAHDKNIGQVHVRDFGSNCLGCHDGIDRMQKFEHSQTGYKLEFKHNEVACTRCHKSENLKETYTECKDCHAEPGMHKGVFNQECSSCHTPENWSPATLDKVPFSHLTTTGFSLEKHRVDYANSELTCATCHLDDLNSLNVKTCIDCHNVNEQVFMNDHLQQFGTQCMVCHDGVDRLSNFDHANFFSLEGKHAIIQCTDCHINNVYRDTPKECSQCHKEPEIHAGVFGLKCEYCHGVDSWTPARLEQHLFPLNHGVKDLTAQLNCEACHSTNYFEYTCYTCHEHQQYEIRQDHIEKGISEQELPDCVKCHPTGRTTEGD